MTTTEMLPAQALPVPEKTPWGLAMTTLWIVAALIGMMIATLIGIFAFFPLDVVQTPEFAKDARAFGILSLLAAAGVVAVLMLAARLRRGWTVSEYLGLTWPGTREVMIAFAVTAAFVVAFDAFTYLIGKDVVTPFQIELYKSAASSGSLPFMWAALILAAPIGEEITFRGFLYRGWARTPRMVWPAIIIISALWAVIHTQYDWFGVFQIFLLGLVLGWVRWRSGSTLVTITLHAMINAWATVQTIIRLSYL
jgi:membrane protease YdiL (CAAX protease family)